MAESSKKQICRKIFEAREEINEIEKNEEVDHDLNLRNEGQSTEKKINYEVEDILMERRTS